MEVAGLAITALDLTARITLRIYSYTKAVQSAPADIRSLNNELFALTGVLEHVRSSATPRPTTSYESETKELPAPEHPPGFEFVLQEAIGFLEALQKDLAPPENESKFRRKLRFAKWPLKDEDVRGHLDRLERVKSYLVLGVMTSDVSATQQIAAEIASLKELSFKAEAGREDRARRRLKAWLSPISPQNVQRDVGKERVSGSGTWLVEMGIFREWVDTKRSAVLWLTGITGAGKTTLMTTATEWLMQAGYATAYFYCQFSETRSQEVRNMLGSLLTQVCGAEDEAWAEIETMHAKNSTLAAGGALPQLESEELRKLLVQNVRRLGEAGKQVFLVMDAVNEMEEPGEILEQLDLLQKEVMEESDGTVKVFLSAINEKGIGSYLEEMKNLVVFTVGEKEIRPDVALLVRKTLAEHPRLRLLPQELQAEITDALTSGAQGMFRWVTCQLSLLSRLRTPGAIRSALEALPYTLDKTYEQLLLRISGPEDRDLAREILEFVEAALSPVSLNEVCEYLQIAPDLPHLDQERALTDPLDILSICGSLLSYDPTADVVSLAHHSVSTYLTSDKLSGEAAFFHIDPVKAQRAVLTKCLRYLTYPTSPFFSKLDEGGYDFPPPIEPGFEVYATHNWPRHLRLLELVTISPDGDPISGLLSAFVGNPASNTGSVYFQNWIRLLFPHSLDGPVGQEILRSAPLYYAASYDLKSLAEWLLCHGADPNAIGGKTGSNPIAIAVFRGHAKMAAILLEKGADPFKREKRSGWSAYSIAKGIGGEVSEVLRRWGEKEKKRVVDVEMEKKQCDLVEWPRVGDHEKG